MEADERRRREQEALSAAVSNPFGGASSAAAAGSPTAKASALPPAPSQNLHVGSNRAEKYLPALPLIDNVSMGKGRVRELEEYHRWCEVLASWLALIDDNYVNELRQAMTHDREIKQSDVAVPVASRSARLFYYLQQSLQKFERGMELVRSTSMRQGQAACGYEVMRQMHQTFSIVSRMEAIAVRDEALRLTSKASSYKRPLDCVRFLEDELGKVDQKLHRFPELRLGASDRSTLLLQSVSPECRHYVVLHGKSGSWEELVESIRFYEEQTRLCDAGSLNAVGERGLCWNCGKSGHMSWQCPDKSSGKGKKRDEPKGGKPSGSKNREKSPKGKGKGKGKTDKGKGGKPKGKPKNKGKPKGRAVEDEQSDQVMAMRSHHLSGLGPGTRTNEPNEAEPPRLTMTNGEIERLNQSSSRNSSFAWLIDSGATCHVLSESALGFYEVVKEHSGPLPVLMSASDTPMECVKLVDIRVKFGKLGPVVLQQVLVCKIGFNVVSSWQASLSGWNTWLTSEPGASCLVKQTERGSSMWVPLVREARSWWALAKEIGPTKAKPKGRRSKGDSPKPGWSPNDDAMEVDKVQKKAPPNVGRALEVTPFKFLLRAFSVKQHVGEHELHEHVLQERLSGCEHAAVAKVGVDLETPPSACCAEALCSAAAVLLKSASNTSLEKQTSRDTRCGDKGFECVGVGPVPLQPQSVCIRSRSALRVGRRSDLHPSACVPECLLGQSEERKCAFRSLRWPGVFLKALLVLCVLGVFCSKPGAFVRDLGKDGASGSLASALSCELPKWECGPGGSLFDEHDCSSCAPFRGGRSAVSFEAASPKHRPFYLDPWLGRTAVGDSSLPWGVGDTGVGDQYKRHSGEATYAHCRAASHCCSDGGPVGFDGHPRRRARPSCRVCKVWLCFDHHGGGSRRCDCYHPPTAPSMRAKGVLAQQSGWHPAHLEEIPSVPGGDSRVAVPSCSIPVVRGRASKHSAKRAQGRACAGCRLESAFGGRARPEQPPGDFGCSTANYNTGCCTIRVGWHGTASSQKCPSSTSFGVGFAQPSACKSRGNDSIACRHEESCNSRGGSIIVDGPRFSTRASGFLAVQPSFPAYAVRLFLCSIVGTRHAYGSRHASNSASSTSSILGTRHAYGSKPAYTSASSTSSIDTAPRYIEGACGRGSNGGRDADDARGGIRCPWDPYGREFRGPKGANGRWDWKSGERFSFDPAGRDEYGGSKSTDGQFGCGRLWLRDGLICLGMGPEGLKAGHELLRSSPQCTKLVGVGLKALLFAVGDWLCALGGRVGAFECLVGDCECSLPAANGSAHCPSVPRSSWKGSSALALGLVLGLVFRGWLRRCVKLLSVRRRSRLKFVRVTLVGRVPRRSWSVVRRLLFLRGVLACELKAEPTGEEAKGPMMKRWRALKKWALCGLGSLRGSEQKKAVARSEALRMLAGLPTPVVVNSESEEELIPDPLEAELAKPSGSEPPRPSDVRKKPRVENVPSGEPGALSSPEVVSDALDPEVPVYLTSERLKAHRNKGHQPYLSCCDTCQSARGRVPARRKHMKHHHGPGELQVDFGFFGKNVRFLLMVHVVSGYIHTVVLGPEDEVPAVSVCKAFTEMGLSGLDIVVHGDQENLLESVFRNAAKHRTFGGRSMHWVPFAINRPQAKGIVERHVCLVKEAFWSVWLGLEERVGDKLPLGSHLFVEAMRYSVRMHNLFHVSKEHSTPLERLRGSTVQPVKSCEFGVVGFGKPQKDYPEHRGKRLVRALYVGPHGANGSGIRVFVPIGIGKPPRLEIFSSFRAKDPVEFDKAALRDLRGNKEDPERPIKFDVPIDGPSPPLDSPNLPEGSLEFPVERTEPPALEGPEAMEEEGELDGYSPDFSDVPEETGMEVEPPGGVGLEDLDAPMDPGEDDAMEEGLTWLYEHGLRQLFDGPDLRVTTKIRKGDNVKEWFRMKFGGKKIWVHVPDNAVCEVSGKVLPRKHLEEGMRLELSELDAFGVATIIGEAEARKRATRRIHTTRWVLTSKPSATNPERVRARLVVRDYAFGSNPLADGIYSPTTSLEALRGVLAIHAVRGGTLLSADVSVAFMQAPVQGVECIRFPNGMYDEENKPLFAQLHKAMNGLRVGPLSWYLEFTSTLRKQFGFGETADPTVHHRLEKDGALTLVLVYVDDLIIFSQNPPVAKDLYAKLAKIYKMKQTGLLEPGKTGQLEFLGRVIARTTEHGPVFFGLKPGYLKSLGEEFGISGKGVKPVLGNLEREYRKKEAGTPISTEAYERYRRVLGKLMWASLTLPHLSYPVGFLGRYQSDPDSQAEACLRRVVRWVMALPEYLQRFSAEAFEYPCCASENMLSGFVDASWNICSVSGAIVKWHGIMIKTFSRKQSVTALSSAEAELAALTEAAKESVYLSLLMETLLYGMPKGETGEFPIHLASDSEAALSISKMTGLLRRVRHLELRHRYLQELVHLERLILSFISGERNPADGLTKSPEELLLEHLLVACGLERVCEEDLQGLVVPEHLRERMEELEEVCEKLEKIPTNLAKYEPVARDLALGSVPLLVIEVFCSTDSALCRACARDRVAYIGITEKEDFLSKSTQMFLGEVLLCLLSRKPPQIYVHIASPCTAGCSYRFKNWHRPKFRHRWREQVKKHVASWKALGRLLEDRCKEILVTQEWPKNCGLWKEESYLKEKKRLGLNFGRVVDRCAFDGVFKRWFFATNREEWSEIFSGKPCDKSHQHVSLASVEETGIYPTKLGRALLRAAKVTLSLVGTPS